MKRLVLHCLGALAAGAVCAGPYAPAPGELNPGGLEPVSTAIAADDERFVGWATGVSGFVRGYFDVAQPGLGRVTYGYAEFFPDDPSHPPTGALGPADAADDSLPVVSLGDAGSMTLTFAQPITNGPGFDLAVFENGIIEEGTGRGFLELAVVEVSSDGVNFTRFPSISLTPTTAQTGSFGTLDPTDLRNLAGKYQAGYGTPFDLAELAGVPLLDITRVTHVRVLDVVGTIAAAFGTLDSAGRLINDPYTTRFDEGGFDLDAIGVLHQVPEPSAAVLLALGAVACVRRRRG